MQEPARSSETEPLLAAARGPLPVAVSVTLSVGGMTCAGCAGRVQRALLEVEGVEDARVDWVSGGVEVSGAAQGVALVRAVEATGKSAVLQETAERTHLRRSAFTSVSRDPFPRSVVPSHILGPIG